MPRDPRVDKLRRLRNERNARGTAAYANTRVTAYGTVQGGPRKRDAGRSLLSLAVFIVVIGGAVLIGGRFLLSGYRVDSASNNTASSTAIIRLNVPSGESSSALADTLQAKGLVFNSFFFYWYLRLGGYTVYSGPHVLRQGMTLQEVAQNVSTPIKSTPAVAVRIQDGWRAEQVAATLAAAHVASYADVMNQVRRGKFSFSFLSDRPPGATLEGYLYPDTYQFVVNGGAHHAIETMLQNFDVKVPARLRAEGKSLYGSFYKAVIMASIIQRESGTPEDDALIAGVLVNRLQKVNPQYVLLQVDASVQHIVGTKADWWPQIIGTDIDRTQTNPYNTYHHAGLPPEPIAEPNVLAITGAVEPTHREYFSYYHMNGSHGKSVFCTVQDKPQCNNAPQ